MTRWIARLANGSAVARPDHRAVFARFVAALAARSPRLATPRVREV
ncbi:hypothetical protein [Pinisolibacter aquiterrae]|nr:hypothetical protein [Pinisolibacter aquiterrae]MBV5263178.1 hypothetical protein [Pinisolibacter aquiterrae]MCC8234092.1 hypothetical protein [Pinisolibacter aquiterrae]